MYFSKGWAGSTRAAAMAASPGSLRHTSWLKRLPVHTCHRRSAASGRLSSSTQWWDKGNVENMHNISTTEELLEALANAGEKLVVLDFYASWCASCRALHPKLCQLAAEYSESIVLKLDFDATKTIARSLGVKVLPYFHMYRGSQGKIAEFSASLNRLHKLRDAFQYGSMARCSIGPKHPLSFSDLTGETPGPAAGI